MALFENDQLETDDKSRLFETHQKTTRSLGSYVKLILIVAIGVSIVGAVIVYFNLPNVGDEVKAPNGLEDGMRAHFLEKEKRTMTGAAVFYCGDFYWVRIGVEKRPDIVGKPNNMVSKYIARATQQQDGTWAITAKPVVSDTNDVPCS